MAHKKQSEFFKTNWSMRFCGGGSLRKRREGRRARPLSTRESIHVVFKARRAGLRKPENLKVVRKVIETYAVDFHVLVESSSIQNDHIHLSIRAPKRALYQNFFRVVAGQIAQRLLRAARLVDKATSFWKERPFTRVIIGQKAWAIVQDYIQLNEKEVRGEIPYRTSRLKGLLPDEWEGLWR